jgi:hypothetical protein
VSEERPEPACPNCGAPAPDRYCPACGQDQREHLVSLRALVGQAAGDLFTWDNRLLRSLGPLVVRPGRLTVEYRRGRRARYIPPLRLYLVISLAFFFAFSLRVGDRPPGPSRDGAAAADSAIAGPDSTATAGLRFGVTWGEDRRELSRDQVAWGVLNLTPKLMFLLLPGFAALLALLYLRQRRHFVEHLVFGLHLHAFAFLLMGLCLLSPTPWVWPGALLVAGFYLYLALRRVYGQGRGKTLAKFTGLVLVYGLSLMVVLGFLLVGTSFLLAEEGSWWARLLG